MQHFSFAFVPFVTLQRASEKVLREHSFSRVCPMPWWHALRFRKKETVSLKSKELLFLCYQFCFSSSFFKEYSKESSLSASVPLKVTVVFYFAIQSYWYITNKRVCLSRLRWRFMDLQHVCSVCIHMCEYGHYLWKYIDLHASSWLCVHVVCTVFLTIYLILYVPAYAVKRHSDQGNW